MDLLTRESIIKASENIKNVVLHTPLQYDEYLSIKYGANIFLKREDLQKVRSFKLRGAYNAIINTNKKILKNGVVCASAGNHAQGVAYTCAKLHIKAVIFMSSTTPMQKISQVKFFGKDFIEIKLSGDTFDETAQDAIDFANAKRMAFIAPFDNIDVIAGQGSLAYEIDCDLTKDEIKADYVICTIGGGGLISGVGAYVKGKLKSKVGLDARTILVGVEPSGAASMKAALLANKPVKLENINKFVDGAAVAQVGELTFAHAKAYVDKVINIDEGLVCSHILELYSKQAIVAEPAGALSIAALDVLKPEILGKNVVVVVSGGNNDIARMAEVQDLSLMYEGLMNYFIVQFPQRAGALRTFLNNVLGEDEDIVHFQYTKKNNSSKGPVVIGVLSKSKEAVDSLLLRIRLFDPHFTHLKDNQALFNLLI